MCGALEDDVERTNEHFAGRPVVGLLVEVDTRGLYLSDSS